MGLVVHVVSHTAQARSVRLSPEDRGDLTNDVFLKLLEDDFAILRHFRGQSSLATYLTVAARRIVVKSLLHQRPSARLLDAGVKRAATTAEPNSEPDERITSQEEVDHLLQGLQETEARVVRMYHLDGMSYHEISAAMGIPENSIGPILSRARSKLRRSRVSPGSH